MAKYEQCSLLQSITELDQLVLASWIVDKEQYLRAPEFDMLLAKPEKVFSHLMIDQALTDISPRFWWSCIMDNKEETYENSHAASRIEAIHEKHAGSTDQCTKCGGLPIEVSE